MSVNDISAGHTAAHQVTLGIGALLQKREPTYGWTIWVGSIIVATGSGPVYGTRININHCHSYGHLAGLLYLHYFCHFHQIQPQQHVQHNIAMPSTTWTARVIKWSNSLAKLALIDDFDLTQQIQNMTDLTSHCCIFTIMHTTMDSLPGLVEAATAAQRAAQTNKDGRGTADTETTTLPAGVAHLITPRGIINSCIQQELTLAYSESLAH